MYYISYSDHTYNNLTKQPKGTVIVLVIPTTFTINNSTFWLFIQIIVSVVGITKTITVPFGCLLRLL
jgi:hypothetical protein